MTARQSEIMNLTRFGFLEEVLDDAPFPYVNATFIKMTKIITRKMIKNYFKPYEIIKKRVIDENGKKQTIKVGVIGAVTPQIHAVGQSKSGWKAHNEGYCEISRITDSKNEKRGCRCHCGSSSYRYG